MKNNKYCKVTGGCWGHRHEILGLVLLILATILTIFTANSIGIAAMYLVGLVLCCYKCLAQHCCYSKEHCHDSDDGMECASMDKDVKHQVKKVAHKTKTK